MARGEDTAHHPGRKVGRETFAPPNPSDAAAPIDLNSMITLSTEHGNAGRHHKDAVFASVEKTLAQGIPVPPASKFPTVGEVNELGHKAFLPAVMEAQKFSGHEDRAPLKGWYEDAANKMYNASNKEKFVRKNEDTPKRHFPVNDPYGYDSY